MVSGRWGTLIGDKWRAGTGHGDGSLSMGVFGSGFHLRLGGIGCFYTWCRRFCFGFRLILVLVAEDGRAHI
jgi:hypothetical protein